MKGAFVKGAHKNYQEGTKAVGSGFRADKKPFIIGVHNRVYGPSIV